jgi:biotin carboxyl carrier protein
LPSSDVSIDLSDHIAVRRSDVQEAVRASKVMSAVEVPQALLDAIDDKASQPEARFDPRSEGRAEPRVGKPPLTKHVTGPLKPPLELPRPPALHDLPAPQSAAPGKRVSPLLVALLVIVVVAGAAFVVWKYVLDTPEPGAESRVQPTAPVAPEPPPPPAPPPPVAKIAMETPTPDDVKTTRAGVVETILADKTAVKTGDVVVRLVGDKPIEADLAAISQAAKKLRDQLDAATKKRDAAQAAANKQAEAAGQAEVDARQKALAVKQDQLATKTTELDKFLLHAPASGMFSPGVKLGQKLTVNDVVATVQREATPAATFTVDDSKRYAVGASVELAAANGEQHVTCTVAVVQGTGVKVSCPAAPALTDGTEVTLRVPGTTPSGTAPPISEPPANPAPAPGAPSPPESQPTAPTAPPPSQEPPAAAVPSSAGSGSAAP